MMNKSQYIIAISITIFSFLLYIAIKKTELKPLYIILLGAGLTIVGATVTAWGSFLQNEKSSKNNAEIKETGEKTFSNVEALKKQNQQLKLDLENRDSKIANQSDKIIELNEKLVQKSEYISDHLTGGDGFPIIVTNTIKARNQNSNDQVTFTLRNENSLPLYDINVNIYDWNYLVGKIIKAESSKPPYISQDNFKKSILYVFEENQMFPNSSIISEKRFDLHDGLLYIKLKSRSSFVFQKIAFITEGNIVYQGFIVYNKHKTLKEWMDKDTPEKVKNAIRAKFKQIPDSVELDFIE